MQLQNNSSNINNTTMLNQSVIESNYGKTRGKRPAARDGHTGIICGSQLIIFGGDRHHMPFNDTFILDVKSELSTKAYLFK